MNRFVTMQAVSWILFSLAILVGAWSMRNTVMLEGTWTLTGTLGFLSELIMVISIQMYLPSTAEPEVEVVPETPKDSMLVCI